MVYTLKHESSEIDRKVSDTRYAWIESDARRYAHESERSEAQYGAFLGHRKQTPSPARILDVGAGPGSLTARIAMCFPSAAFTALKVSPVMMQ